MSRTTRDDATRNALSRTPAVVSPRDIPPEMLPEGMECIWANETVRGEYQSASVSRNLNESQFEPLTTDQVPAFKRKSLPGRETTDELVRDGGQVLMGRPKAIGDAERAARKREALESVGAAMGRHNSGVASVGAARDPQDSIRVEQERARPQFKE